MAITKGIIDATDLRRMYDPIMDQRVGVGAALSQADMQRAQIEHTIRQEQINRAKGSRAADAQQYTSSISQSVFNPGRYDPIQMIAMRLRTPEGMTIGFQHISVCERPGKVFVFVVAKDQPTIIEDDPILFPSDTLIAALHLLKG